MKVVVQNFIGTTEEWEIKNPVLYDAVWGFEIIKDADKNKRKILTKLGNGKDPWKTLKYFDSENIKDLPEKFQEIFNKIEEKNMTVESLKESIKHETEEREEKIKNIIEIISEETEIRQEADVIINERINQEIENRNAAYESILENIREEKETRETEDEAIREAMKLLAPEGLEDIPVLIKAEADERKNADEKIRSDFQEADEKMRNDFQEADEILQTEILNKLFPVGEVVVQYPNTMSPKEKGLPGDWRICNDKAYRYLLRQEVPTNYTVYTQGANYAVGAWVMYHLPGDDWNFFQARVAITNAPSQLNPVNWTEMRDGSIVDQRFLHGYTDDDFKIGTQVPDGEYAGYNVAAIYVYGGKYAGVAGGNRPTFGSATAGDRIRNISGRFLGARDTENDFFEGIYFNNGDWLNGRIHVSNTTSQLTVVIRSNSNRVVPTGVDNAPRTFPIILWQRIN